MEKNRTAASSHDRTSIWSDILWSSRNLEWIDLGDIVVRERGNIPGSEMVLLVGGVEDRGIVEAYVDIWVVKGVLRAEVVCSVSVDSGHHGVVGRHEGVVAEGSQETASVVLSQSILVVAAFLETFYDGGCPGQGKGIVRVRRQCHPCHPTQPHLRSQSHSSLPFPIPIPVPSSSPSHHLTRPRRPRGGFLPCANAGESLSFSRLCHPQNGWKRHCIIPRFSA